MRHGLPSPPRAAATNLQRAQAFLQAFLERAADRHRFANAFHLRSEPRVGLREFLEGEPRDLGNDIVNGRLEARRGFACDVDFDFVEQITHRELGSDFRNGKASGLGRGCRLFAFGKFPQFRCSRNGLVRIPEHIFERYFEGVLVISHQYRRFTLTVNSSNPNRFAC